MNIRDLLEKMVSLSDRFETIRLQEYLWSCSTAAKGRRPTPAAGQARSAGLHGVLIA